MKLVDIASSPIVRIEVRLKVGHHLMAATDDPVFLELRGPGGREFRLLRSKGKSFRRGTDQHFILSGPEDSPNVANPEFNDPNCPALDVAGITAVCLRKGSEPIPNVRAVAEMDDRLEISEVDVEIYTGDGPEPLRFHRDGPVWLGLICGLGIELAPVPSAS